MPSDAPPIIQEGQWITVGQNHIDAYVFRVIAPDELSIGYLQGETKPTRESVRWEAGRWEFSSPGPDGLTLPPGPEAALLRRGPSRR